MCATTWKLFSKERASGWVGLLVGGSERGGEIVSHKVIDDKDGGVFGSEEAEAHCEGFNFGCIDMCSGIAKSGGEVSRTST